MNQTEQLQRLRKGKEFLENLLGTSVKTFIPPMNRFDDSTIKACVEAGIEYISSSLDFDKPYFETVPKRYPSTVETENLIAVYPARYVWIPRQYERILGSLQDSLSKYGYALVTVHPQQFSKVVETEMMDQIEEEYLSDFLRLVGWVVQNQIVVQLRQLDESRYVSLRVAAASSLSEIANRSRVVIAWQRGGEQMNFTRKLDCVICVPTGAVTRLSAVPTLQYTDRKGERFLIFLETSELVLSGQFLNFTAKQSLLVSVSAKKQYYLSVISEHGNPEGEGWYDSGAYATVFVNSPIPRFGQQYVLVGWEGTSNQAVPRPAVLMDRPKVARAIWAVDSKGLYYLLAVLAAVLALFLAYAILRRSRSK